MRITRDGRGAMACPSAGAEQASGNVLDDDCDFMADRDDPDCRPDGVCWGAVELACGTSVTATIGPGATMVTAAAGEPVFLVVDAAMPNGSPYTVSVACH